MQQIRGMLIGSVATIAVAAGVFTAVAMANAADDPPAPPATPTVVATEESTVTPTPAPEPTVVEPTVAATPEPSVAPVAPTSEPAQPPVASTPVPAQPGTPLRPGTTPPPDYTGPLAGNVIPGTQDDPVAPPCGHSDENGEWVSEPCG